MKGLWRWLMALLVGLLGVMGLFVAAEAGVGGLHVAGLLLFAAAVFIVMAIISQFFDGVPENRILDIWPTEPASNRVLLAGLALLGLVGMVAASSDRSLYWVGLSVAAVSWVMCFYALKRIYDALDRRRSGQSHDGPTNGHAA